MKKSITKLDKTTVSKPETTIEAVIHVTKIIDDELSKQEAQEVLSDILRDADLDHLEIKQVKTFFREV